ncbi:MAG TPA: YdbH domain-containing protein, partial [Phenylobacterium sp.]
GDPPETAALKRALAGFRFAASSVEVSASREDLSISLGVPVRLHTDTGGEVTLYRVGGPIFANDQGAFDLKVSGGGLPEAELAVSRYALTKDGLVAKAAMKAKGGFAQVSGGDIEAEGDIRLADGAITFISPRCISLAADRVELGENDLEQVDGRLCPGSAPLVSFADGSWRLRGKAEGLAGRIPSVEAAFSQGSATVDLSGSGGRMAGQVGLADVRVEDTAAEKRFYPVRAAGRAIARAGGWTGMFDVTDPERRRLASGTFRHGADGRGAADFDTGQLAFAADGLQPAKLSPLAELIASPATGSGRMTGQIAWSPDTFTSHGDLVVDRLDFVSPMGPVVGLAGHVALSSLLPLAAAPGQVMTAEAVNTLVPLTNVDVRFGLAEEAAVVEGASLAVGGGSLVFEPFTLPFDTTKPWTGVVNFNVVEMKDLVEASPFGDRVDLQAKLSGRVPFAVSPEGVRVTDGNLYAVAPGRLSILREALTPVASTPTEAVVSGAVTGVQVPLASALSGGGQVNTFSEFGYQAMEDLAFDTLDAQVNSQENGRLGVLMHLKGRHDPPQRQEIRLTLMELIRRDFMNKALPLPSGTKVDLTLDTSINLDQILKDFADFQALRGSHPVQP